MSDYFTNQIKILKVIRNTMPQAVLLTSLFTGDTIDPKELKEYVKNYDEVLVNQIKKIQRLRHFYNEEPEAIEVTWP